MRGRGTSWERAAIAAALAASLAGAHGAVGADATDGAAGSEERGSLRGRIDLRYVGRFSAGREELRSDDDHDLIQDGFAEGKMGRFRFEVSGRVREDVDGQPERSVFRDIHDTAGDRARAYLYTAFGEAADLGPVARVRLGRQYYGEGVEVRFYGALVETASLGRAVRLTGYGGVPVHLFEASIRGDWLAGAAVELTAIPRTTVRVDYAHVTDLRRDLRRLERIDGSRRSTVRDDDYFQLVAVHRLLDWLRVRGEASTFEGRSSRFAGDLLADVAGWGLTGRLRALVQLGAYRDLSIQFTPYDEVLGAYEPYHEVLGELGKTFGEPVSVRVGAALRTLVDGGDEGPFNREFARVFGSLTVTDLPWKGLSATPLAELYFADGGDRFFQASLDLAQELGPVTVGAGTGYALYRFDEFFLEERERVRTVHGSLEWRIVEGVRVRASYTFERDDEEDYHVARVDMRFSF